MNSRAFLDIDIGDPLKFAEDTECYERATKFYQELYPTYGWADKPVEQCTEEEQEILASEFASRKQPGKLCFARPVSLRAGRVVIELADDCPKTVANFKALCTGEKGKSKFKKEKDLHYKGCAMHRIVTGFIAQVPGGDVTIGDGSGGESIYGAKFNDEKAGLTRKFARGTVGMANSGKNTNTSQFFFTLTNDGAKLNGKYVAFGRVVEGLEVLDKLNEVGTAEGNTTAFVCIVDCGLL